MNRYVSKPNKDGEPCEDAISREAVNILVDELARAISDERCCMSRGRSTATIMQDILDLPSVTPKQRTGHWIRKTNDYGVSSYMCSECGKWHPTHNHSLGFDYCNGCGAKMVEPQESEEQA